MAFQRPFNPTRDFSAADVLFTFERQMKTDHAYHKVSGGNYSVFNGFGLGELMTIPSDSAWRLIRRGYGRPCVSARTAASHRHEPSRYPTSASWLHHHLDAAILLVAERLVEAGAFFERGLVGDDKGRVDLAINDLLEKRR